MTEREPSTLKDVAIALGIVATIFLLIPPVCRLMDLYMKWWWGK